MKKSRGKWKNSNCLLLGILMYSLLFLMTAGSINHTFGIIIVALLAFVLYCLENHKETLRIQSRDVIYTYCSNLKRVNLPVSAAAEFETRLYRSTYSS